MQDDKEKFRQMLAGIITGTISGILSWSITKILERLF